MARLSKMFAIVATAARDAVLGGGRRPRRQNLAPGAPAVAPQLSDDEQPSPGQTGPDATVEVDPATIGRVSMTYGPDPDGEPDPGEVVWTWVPFEENDGRGKDRPVLLVAAEPAGTYLGVQLTSKRHHGADFVAVGAGGWDFEHRPSWANLDRVIRIHPTGMRREGTALAHKAFKAVTGRLSSRYGWQLSDR